MKQTIILLVFVACIGSVYAAAFGVDVGFYAPNGPKPGIIWGVETFKVIDERVDITFSGNLYMRTEEGKQRKVEINDGHGNHESHSTDSVVDTRYIPLMLGVRFNINEFNGWKPFAGISIGMAIAWENILASAVKEKNPAYDPVDNPDVPEYITLKGAEDKSFAYVGLPVQLNTGVSYALGSNSELYSKVYYNFSNFTRDRKDGDNGIISKELNMSGIGLSVGFRVNY